MKKFLYILLIALVPLAGCKKKTTTTTTPPTPTPTGPTMNYVTFTINGFGLANKTFTFSKDKDNLTRYEYNQNPDGTNYTNIDFERGDTSIQVRFADKTAGNKPFVSNSVYFIFTINDASNPIVVTSFTGGYNLSIFTPTNLVENTTSHAFKGKAQIEGTFSGNCIEDNSGRNYTLSGGVIKFDGK